MELPLSKRLRLPLFWVVLLFVFLVAQFSGTGLFHRELINHDDTRHIAPLEWMPLREYFHSWLPNRGNFAFPLTDLTYALDFQLLHEREWNTFWLQNLLLLFAFLFLFDRISRLFLPALSLPRLAAIAFFLLHPALTEVVQWAYLRKTLLVADLLGAATFFVLRARQEQRPPSRGEWLAIGALYLLSLLAFPSGILWIFWAAAALHGKRAGRRTAAGMGVAGLALGLAYLGWLTAAAGEGYGGLGAKLQPFLVLAGFGRAAWTLAFPFWLAPYYSPASPFTFAGLALALLAAALARKHRRSLFPSWPLLALAAAFALPPFYLVLTYPEFVWADRYLFLPLPYLLLGLAIPAEQAGKKPPKLVLLSGLLLLEAFAFSSHFYAPYWLDSYPLMSQCAETEKSDGCLFRTMEMAFDRGNCAKAGRWIDAAEKRSQSGSASERLFTATPFYREFCTATDSSIPIPERRRRIESTVAFFGAPAASVRPFALGLLSLQERDLEGALQMLEHTAASPASDLFSPVSLNSLLGQAQALCEIQPGPRCAAVSSALERKIPAGDSLPPLVAFGRERSLKAWNARQER